MKKIFLIVIVVAALQACDSPRQENNTAETADMVGSSYGVTFAEENVIPASTLQQRIETQDSVHAIVEAVVVESCQAKGCWMDVQLNDSSTMKVTFKDYGFFVPTEDLSGKKVVVTGTAKKKLVTVDARRHYAQDAGKSEAEINAITTPSEEIRFVADGVIIK